jgi:hypothetical protein
VDAAAAGARGESQGGFWPVSDLRSARTNGAGCGRRSRVVLAPVAGVKSAEATSARPGADDPSSADDGDKRNSSPGRARRKPLKPLRRECRAISGVTVVSNSCAFYFCTRGRGRIGRPAFPAPSDFWGRTLRQNSRARAARSRGRVLRVTWLFENRIRNPGFIRLRHSGMVR